MSRILDKFTYTTIYKQDYCVKHQLPRNVNKFMVEPLPGVSAWPPSDPTSRSKYPCPSRGYKPPREAMGPPKKYLDKSCLRFLPEETNKNTGLTLSRGSPPDCHPLLPLRPLPRGAFGGPGNRRAGDRQRDNRDARDGPPWLRERMDERREIDALRLRRHPPRGEAHDVIHEEEGRARGGQYYNPPVGGRRRMSATQSELRIPGPYWIRQRPDERREIDVSRRRKFETPSEIRDIIHGEGTSGENRRASIGGYPTRRPAPSSSATRIPGPFWMTDRRDERREIEAPRRRRFSLTGETKDLMHGGGYGKTYDLPSRCRPSSGSRIPGPFWMSQRPDERRDPDLSRRRKFEPRGDLHDVIHGEEARAREWEEARERRRQSLPMNLYDLPPGPSHADPFWLLERQDERRDPDMDRKRKFRRKKIEAAEIIHGEDFRTRWDPPEDRQDHPGPDRRDEGNESDEDESEEFPSRTARCGPAPNYDFELGPPDGWLMDQDFDGYDAPEPDWAVQNDWDRGRGQRGFDIPPDVEEKIRRPPAARVSCVPTGEASNFDQPNAFMRKLYQKYPYLYQVLNETPPEELISRVFKDRFMSTYQVDYLHMGVGRLDGGERGGGFRGAEGRGRGGFAGPDGEPEPETIPGCSYRHSQKGDFGRKKQPKLKEKEDKEEREKDKDKDRDRDRDKDDLPTSQEEREEPRISEYMATISRLGNDIMQDRLYRIAEVTKNMKNQYKKL